MGLARAWYIVSLILDDHLLRWTYCLPAMARLELTVYQDKSRCDIQQEYHLGSVGRTPGSREDFKSIRTDSTNHVRCNFALLLDGAKCTAQLEE